MIGGLYGNPFAAEALNELISQEKTEPLVVLNGDVHWFDRTPETFAATEQAVGDHVLLLGNVEEELIRTDDVGVGCGCAYPESCFDDESVERSNRIHAIMKDALADREDLLKPLRSRGRVLIVDVCGSKLAITHGDEKLLGGWDCCREMLETMSRQLELDEWFERTGVDIFATTHTCEAVAMRTAHGVLINNGAAGMPNFADQDFGIVTRIARDPLPDALFETTYNGLSIQSLPLRFDHEAFVAWFDELWPEGTPGEQNYRRRIITGGEDRIAVADLGGFERSAAYRPERTHRVTTEALVAALDNQPSFLEEVEKVGSVDEIMRTEDRITTLQLNIGRTCNLACTHCHVESGPACTESMTREGLEDVLEILERYPFETLDITGGAPEMNPHAAWFIREASKRIDHIMVRSNLVILDLPEYEHFIDLFAELGIHVIASLPTLSSVQAEEQRGIGTFDPSLDILRKLNAVGYGSDPRLKLDLVFNPQQEILPPAQEELESLYRDTLEHDHGVVFDQLLTMTNIPLGRHGKYLLREGLFDDYLTLLRENFNPSTLNGLMCRSQISVGWDCTIYDCDFNQVLGMTCQKVDFPDADGNSAPLYVRDLIEHPSLMENRTILTGSHCYACTAGAGSSCGGTIVLDG